MTARKCRCKSRAGVQKRCYRSRWGAFRSGIQSGRTYSEPYRCPSSKGVWHLRRMR